tara:strand:+ start:154 stop:315 length:162 start_codon:yes stop_codon:yes gene_type:complete
VPEPALDADGVDYFLGVAPPPVRLGQFNELRRAKRGAFLVKDERNESEASQTN